MPAYFLVRVPRQLQHDRKNKIGSIYLHPGFVFLTRGMQSGEIVAIGSIAHDMLPQARVGHLLLFHHFVEAATKQQCVYMDQLFNYYVVTATSHNGQNNQTYGIWDGKQFIPHFDYLFLKVEAPPKEELMPEDRLTRDLVERKSGIFVFKEWKLDRDMLTERMKNLKKQIDSLNKSKMTPEIMEANRTLEEEMNRISKMLAEKRYQRFTLIAANPDFLQEVEEHFDTPVTAGDEVYMLNIACETKMEFGDHEYIVAKSIHFGCPTSWTKKMVRKELA